MDLRNAIMERLGELRADEQRTVLDYVNRLAQHHAHGETGSSLLAFAGSMDPASAQEITAAIEAAFESVDEREW